jgi:N-acetylmuramoyl-L-alanine amidase
VVPGAPPIHPRTEWQARDPNVGYAYASRVKAAFVHHTTNDNTYAPQDVPAMLRSIQAYHMDVNGWNDIGYNFVVDRFGGIWEARGGGVDKAVVGAQIMGFNTGSTGVAVLGDFTSVWPSEAAVNAVADIIGWKLTLSSVDPKGSVILTAGPNPEFTEGSPVTFATISGHRDGFPTSCPGALLYARLDDIRERASAWHPNILGSVDGVQRVPGGVRVHGWAIDVNTTNPIQVHAYVDGLGYAGGAGLYRGDVGASYTAYGPLHGFAVDAPAPPGSHRLCVFGINDVPGYNALIGCRDVYVDPNPNGSLDLVDRVPGGLRVAGWALDPDTASPVPVHVYAGGALTAVPTGANRPDVAAVWQAYGAGHGFDATVAAAPGPQNVCAYAIDTGPGDNMPIGCRTTNVAVNPVGSLDLAVGGTGTIRVAGWAMDPDTGSPIPIHVYADGAFAGASSASGARTDIAQAFPAYGGGHGFDGQLLSAPGVHTLCVYGINIGAGVNSVLGCRSVLVS